MPNRTKNSGPLSDLSPGAVPAASSATTEQRLHAARTHAQGLIDQLQALAAAEPESQQPTWNKHISAIRDALYFAEGAQGGDQRRDAVELTPSQQRDFGKLLRDRRDAAGFTRAELARRAKISDTLIKQIEYGKESPTRRTLIRLMEVEALGLTWADVPEAAGAAPNLRVPGEPSAPASGLNCYLPPLFDPVGMIVELSRFLNGDGGHVEQTAAYLDHTSAADYVRMCRNSRYSASFRQGMPLAPIAKQIVETAGGAPLHVIALGAGEGALEVRLVQHLVDELTHPDIRLCLFDISQPLLNEALQLASITFDSHPGVHAYGVQGNFHKVTTYPQAYYLPPGSTRRRVYTLLGSTMANLDNEVQFFQDNLVEAAIAPGDLLVLDLQLAHAPVEDPDEIRRRDPAFQAPLPSNHADWLAGPFFRYCRDTIDVKFHLRLDTRCSVPGSYVLNAIATVQSHNRPNRQFSVLRFRRYDPEKLSRCLSELGWEQLAANPFGTETEKTSMVMLFRKR